MSSCLGHREIQALRRRLGEREGNRQSWTNGTAVTDIFNERFRTENSCSVTSINENPHESQANGNLNWFHTSAVLFSHAGCLLELIYSVQIFQRCL